jgi:hypothetical protein
MMVSYHIMETTGMCCNFVKFKIEAVAEKISEIRKALFLSNNIFHNTYISI